MAAVLISVHIFLLLFLAHFNIAYVSYLLIQCHNLNIVLIVDLGDCGFSWHPILRTVDDHVALVLPLRWEWFSVFKRSKGEKKIKRGHVSWYIEMIGRSGFNVP